MRKKSNKLLQKGEAVSVAVWVGMTAVSAGSGMRAAAGMQGCTQGNTTLPQLSTAIVAACRSAACLFAPRASFYTTCRL